MHSHGREHVQSATNVIPIEENHDGCRQSNDRLSDVITQDQHAPGPYTGRKRARDVHNRSSQRVSLGLKHCYACSLTIESMAQRSSRQCVIYSVTQLRDSEKIHVP